MEKYHFRIQLEHLIFSEASLFQLLDIFVHTYFSLDIRVGKSWENSSLRHPEIYKNPQGNPEIHKNRQVHSKTLWDTQDQT